MFSLVVFYEFNFQLLGILNAAYLVRLKENFICSASASSESHSHRAQEKYYFILSTERNARADLQSKQIISISTPESFQTAPY